MIIVTLIPLLIFSAILYLRFNKGKIAEKMVHYKLMQLPEEYHVIDNVLFMSNGRSTQIDHIVVSPYAVFVIETKGYKGWIFGGRAPNIGRKAYTNTSQPFTAHFCKMMAMCVS